MLFRCLPQELYQRSGCDKVRLRREAQTAKTRERCCRRPGRHAPFWLVVSVASFVEPHPCAGPVGGRSSQEKQRLRVLSRKVFLVISPFKVVCSLCFEGLADGEASLLGVTISGTGKAHWMVRESLPRCFSL